MRLLTRLRSLLPGFAILIVIALSAHGLGDLIAALSPLIVAIGTGAIIGNTIGTPDWAQAGVSMHKLLLETGIVLLGAQLTVSELVNTGPTVIALSAAVVVLGILYMETVVGRIFSVGNRTISLLAAGTSVCGVSAVLAVAGSIDVDETDITYAVATILLFDAVTLLIFPVFGELLHVSGKQFGIWAGLSLFSTGPTAAVGFAVSETAGQWATVTKLVRNTFIGVLAVGYALQYATADAGPATATKLWSRFPKFLFGLMVVAAIANAGILSANALASIKTTGDWLFLLAFAGLGFDIDLDDLRSTGIKPVFLVLIHLATVSTVTLLVVLYLF